MDKFIKWIDGSIDKNVPGKLLSENLNYYGDCIMTGITYEYITPLTGRGDTSKDEKDFIGRRLLDGRLSDEYRKLPAESNSGLMEVVFDLKDIYSFTEFDLICNNQIKELEISLSVDNIGFKSAYTECNIEKKPLIRCRIEEKKARYIKLKITSDTVIKLYQVWIWGYVLEEIELKSRITSANKFQFANSIAQESVMGVPSTAFSDIESFVWSEKLRKGNITGLDAVWSEQPSYDELLKRPILPNPTEINKPVARRICRNGSEVVCLSLTNTSICDTKDIKVEVVNDSGLRTKLYAIGVMDSRWYGEAASPLFNEECCISKPLMRKYIKNSDVIEDFPNLHLPISGTCLLWLVIFADEHDEGNYTISLKAGNSYIDINTEILPFTLKKEKVMLETWSTQTKMFPFEWSDRAKKEADYRNELGINIYELMWPKNGNVAELALKDNPTVQFSANGLGKYHGMIYNNQVTVEQIEAAEEDLKESLAKTQAYAESLGLTNDQWYIYLPDEPGRHNAAALGAAVRISKKFFPNIRLFANPAFWVGLENGVTVDDEVMCQSLEGWYDLIDISMPLLPSLWDRPESYNKYYKGEREFNGQYLVSGQHMCSDRCDLIQLSRCSAWESISRDMNVWGFYSYHQPRLNTWDNKMCMNKHIDPTINYQCVHAGLYGPVPTRASEGIREGYQDYQIMQLLKEQNYELYKQLQAEFLDGKRDFEYFRNIALDSLVKK